MAVPFVTRGGNLLPPPPTTTPTTLTAVTASLSLTIQVDEHNLDSRWTLTCCSKAFCSGTGSSSPRVRRHLHLHVHLGNSAALLALLIGTSGVVPIRARSPWRQCILGRGSSAGGETWPRLYPHALWSGTRRRPSGRRNSARSTTPAPGPPNSTSTRASHGIS